KSGLCLLAVSSLAAACGGAEEARMRSQGAAFALVQAALSAALPGTAIEEPEGRWWTEPRPGTDTSAVVIRALWYSGLYCRRAAVDVAWRGSIGASAYTHELMHYFLDRAGRGSDAGHGQTQYWELVERIDLQLQREGM